MGALERTLGTLKCFKNEAGSLIWDLLNSLGRETSQKRVFRKFGKRLIPVEICIPAFDELANLQVLVPRILEEVTKIEGFEFSIKIFVRNNEPVESLKELHQLSAKVILRNPRNDFGSAIYSAVRSIGPQTRYVIFMDADGSHNPARIVTLINEIRSKSADIVIASRYVSGGKTDNPRILIALSRLLNVVFAFVIGVKCRDISTNFKIYDANILRGIELECANFDVIEELLFKINKAKQGKALILEIPDHFEKRNFGESKRKMTVFIFSYIVTLIKLRARIKNEAISFRK